MAKGKPKGKDKRALASITAAEVMVKEVKTVPQSMWVRDLVKWLALMKMSGAPVVDESGKLVGVISETNIVKAQAQPEGKNYSCFSFYEYDPFAGGVGSFEECTLKMLEMRVRDLMTREVITALPQESLDLVIQRLLAHHIHRLIVAEEQVILGIISTPDIMRALASGKIALTAPVAKFSDLVSETSLVASEDMLIRELIDLLTEKGVTGLPVVREDGTVVGVISQSDIVRSEAETDRRRYKYPDFYSPDPSKKGILLVTDFDQEVLERRVKEFMNPRVISVHPETPFASVAETMVAERVHRLMLVDQDGRLQGVVGTLDLIKALV
jgi:CBS-domain-containing membrane protein